MNKIQYIKLLETRGITELKGMSLNQVIEGSGGEPTEKEMVMVNELAMKYYIEKYKEEKDNVESLTRKVERLEERDEWLSCLEAAGVDNWDGYDIARDILKGEY